MTVQVHNALDEAFAAAYLTGSAVLIPYLTAGFPDRSEFVDLAVAVLDAGGDALEIGIPFSDPLLDGPSTQYSQQVALEAGITPPDCLEYARQIHERTGKPLVFMGAYNPMLAYGLERFVADGAARGITGIITPDLPFEEQEDLLRCTLANNLHLIQMVAPTTSPERMERVTSRASGFIYGISIAGVTGARANLAQTARPMVERVKALTDVPVAVGFGISEPEQAAQVGAFADAVIVGSALIDVVGNAAPSERLRAVTTFIQGLRQAA